MSKFNNEYVLGQILKHGIVAYIDEEKNHGIVIDISYANRLQSWRDLYLTLPMEMISIEEFNKVLPFLHKYRLDNNFTDGYDCFWTRDELDDDRAYYVDTGIRFSKVEKVYYSKDARAPTIFVSYF